jgi:lipoteichoic acid synthase
VSVLFTELAPTLVALVGLILLWSKPSGLLGKFRLDSVLICWSVVAFLAHQTSFMLDAHLAWKSSAVWGVLLGGAGPAMVLLLLPSRRWRAVVAWLIVAASSMLLIVDHLYFAWFGDMFPAVALLAIRQVSGITDMAQEWTTFRDFWDFIELVLILPVVIAEWRNREATGARAWRYWALGVATLVAALSGWQTTAAIRADPSIVTQRFSNLSLVEQIGPLPFHALDGWLLMARTLETRLVSEATFEEELDWLKARAPQRAGTGPWFGAATGKNLIVIQVESLQEPVVNLQINGRDVMPNLRKLAAQHLYFSNMIDQTDEGRTSDAEWSLLASQFPERQGAAAFANEGNHLVGLPSVLASRGYQSLSAVPFSPGFWNRRVMHPNLGFFRSYFAGDFAPGESIGWGLNDHDFLQQMIPRLAATRQPFIAWLITLSLHYPFGEFPASHKELDVTPWEGQSFGNYLHGMHYFDRALGEFLDGLAREGLLEKSVIVVTGDHSAGFRWQPEIAHALGFSNDIAHWTAAERVPMMVRVPGAAAQVVTRPAGQVDFAPTILNLLGIDASSLPYVGRNMLGSPGEEPIIRRKGSWVTERHLFLLRGPANGSHCYDRKTLLDVPLADCEAESATALRKALLPRRISELDLQQRLYSRMAADVATR